MLPEEAIDLARLAITTLLQVSLPLMLVSLVVGVAIALIQALTQVQELTLTFVPKIIVVFLSMILFLPYMLDRMFALMQIIADRISSLA